MENNTIALIKSEQKTLEKIIFLNCSNMQEAQAIALQEIEYLKMHMVTKDFIEKCIPETIIQAVKYTLKNKLSLDPNAGLVYLMPISVKVDNVWKTALEIKPTADGRISIARQCYTILDNKRPQIAKDATGKVTKASVEILLPSTPEPRWELVEIDQDDFDRLRGYSHRKNARNKTDANADTLNYANPLYTSHKGGIEPEFARSKVVSIALKKRGTNQNFNSFAPKAPSGQWQDTEPEQSKKENPNPIIVEESTAEVISSDKPNQPEIFSETPKAVVLPDPSKL